MKKSELRKLIKQTIKEQHINSKQTKLASGGRPVGTTTTNACPAMEVVVQAPLLQEEIMVVE